MIENVNPDADVSVKLVSEVGVGTVAAGVAKGHADTIIVSPALMAVLVPAHSPRSSMLACRGNSASPKPSKPLILNDLRGRVRLQTDGQLRTGRDVIIAAMLGAEEYAFGTLGLVLVGCIMMRKCHLGTCPVGVATQTPELRAKFDAKADHVVNFFTFLAQEVREYLAELGMRSLDELIGRSDLLETNQAISHWKASGLISARCLRDLMSALKSPFARSKSRITASMTFSTAT